ncbi:hypothetical protein ACFZCV_35520 [Streptomyces sp. NPDC007920]|uniref:hypothetical protein n=1 Tax=Streptomyces sp. NPDC007920 TaxID=3364794 RepID=UPI0036E57622
MELLDIWEHRAPCHASDQGGLVVEDPMEIGAAKEGWRAAVARRRPPPDRLTTRSAWIDRTGELPIIEGTLIRLEVEHLPGGHDPLPVWLSLAAGIRPLSRIQGHMSDARFQ